MKVNKNSQSQRLKSQGSKNDKTPANKKSRAANSFEKKSKVEVKDTNEIVVPKSVENVSYSVRKKAAKSPVGEMYKRRHNIGRRQAAERVGSYDESEVLISYQDGFYSSGSVSARRHQMVQTKQEAGEGTSSETLLGSDKLAQSFDDDDERPTYHNVRGSAVAKTLKFDVDEKTSSVTHKPSSAAAAAAGSSGKKVVEFREKNRASSCLGSSQSEKNLKVKPASGESAKCLSDTILSDTLSLGTSGTRSAKSTKGSKASLGVSSSTTSSVSNVASSRKRILASIVTKAGDRRQVASLSSRKVNIDKAKSTATVTKLPGQNENRKRRLSDMKALVNKKEKNEDSCSLPVRPKREACLNAGAFMSLMYVGKKSPRKSLTLQRNLKDLPVAKESVTSIGSPDVMGVKPVTPQTAVTSDSKTSVTSVTKGSVSSKKVRSDATKEKVTSSEDKKSSHESYEKRSDTSKTTVTSNLGLSQASTEVTATSVKQKRGRTFPRGLVTESKKDGPGSSSTRQAHSADYTCDRKFEGLSSTSSVKISTDNRVTFDEIPKLLPKTSLTDKKETVKKVPSKAPKILSAEIPKKTYIETGKRTSSETSMLTSSETSKIYSEAVKKTLTEIPKKGLLETVTKSSEMLVKDLSDTPKKASYEIPKKVASEIPKKSSLETAAKAPLETPKKASLETPKKAGSASVESARAKLLVKSTGAVSKGRVSLPLSRNRKSLDKKPAKRTASFEPTELPKLPKRMASLNAQAILAASRETWVRTPSSQQRKNSPLSTVESPVTSLPQSVASTPLQDVSPTLHPTSTTTVPQGSVVLSPMLALQSSSSSSTDPVKDSAAVTPQATSRSPQATSRSLKVKPSTVSALEKPSKLVTSPNAKFQTPGNRAGGARAQSAGKRKSLMEKPATPTPFTLVESPSGLLADPRICYAGSFSEVPSPTPNKHLLEMRPVHGGRGTSGAVVATRLSYPLDSPTTSHTSSSTSSSVEPSRGLPGDRVADSGAVSESSTVSITSGQTAGPHSGKTQKESFLPSTSAVQEKQGKGSGGRRSTTTSKVVENSTKAAVEKSTVSSNAAKLSVSVVGTQPGGGNALVLAAGSAVVAGAAAQAGAIGVPAQSSGYYAAPLPAHSTYPSQPSVRFTTQPNVLQQQQYINQYTAYPSSNGFYSYQTGGTNGAAVGTVYPTVGTYPVGAYNFDPRYMTSYRTGAGDYRQMPFQQYTMPQPRQYQTAMGGFRMYDGGSSAAGTQFVPVVFQQQQQQQQSVGTDTAAAGALQAFTSQQPLNSLLTSLPVVGAASGSTGYLLKGSQGGATSGSFLSVDEAARSVSGDLGKNVTGQVRATGQERVLTRSDAAGQSSPHEQNILEAATRECGGAQSKDCAVQVRSRGAQRIGGGGVSTTAGAITTSFSVTAAGAVQPHAGNASVQNVGGDSGGGMATMGVGLIPYQIHGGGSTSQAQAYVIVAGPTAGSMTPTNPPGSSSSSSGAQPTGGGCVALYPGSFVIRPTPLANVGTAVDAGSTNGVSANTIGVGGVGQVVQGNNGRIENMGAPAGQYSGGYSTSFTVLQGVSQAFSGLNTENGTQERSQAVASATTDGSNEMNQSAPGTADTTTATPSRAGGGSQPRAQSSLAKILPKNSGGSAGGVMVNATSIQIPIQPMVQPLKQPLLRRGGGGGSSAHAPESGMQTITIGPGQLIVETFQDKELDLSRKTVDLSDSTSPGTSSKSSETIDLTKKKKKRSPKPQMSLQLPDVLMSTQQHTASSSSSSPSMIKHRLTNRSRHRMPALVPLPGHHSSSSPSPLQSFSSTVLSISRLSRAESLSTAQTLNTVNHSAVLNTSTSATSNVVELVDTSATVSTNGRPYKRRKQRSSTSDPSTSSSDAAQNGVGDNGVIESRAPAVCKVSLPVIAVQPASDPSTSLPRSSSGCSLFNVLNNNTVSSTTQPIIVSGQMNRISTEPLLISPNLLSSFFSVDIPPRPVVSKILSPSPIRRSVSVGCDGAVSGLSLSDRGGASPTSFTAGPTVTSKTPPPVVQYGKKTPSPGSSGNPPGGGNPKGSKGTKRKSDSEVEVVRKKSKQLQGASAAGGTSGGKVAASSSRSGRPGSGCGGGRRSDGEEGGRKTERSPPPVGGGKKLDEGSVRDESEGGGSRERKEKSGGLSRKSVDDPSKKLSSPGAKRREIAPSSSSSSSSSSTTSQAKWSWSGEAELKPMYTQVDGPAVMTSCYAAICHTDGDVINTRDCVLVKSGMRKKDIPYVAKIYGFWESEAGEMLMGVLWYYRLEHTETQPLPKYIDSEVFASRHRDVIPVACIEDRCYVLTLNEFNRYKAAIKKVECYGVADSLRRCRLVPGSTEAVCTSRLPPVHVDQETVFLCRHIYDIKLKRILKNPQIHIPPGLQA